MSNESTVQSNTTYALISRLWRESIRPYINWICLAFVFMAIVAGATGYSAYLMKPVINDIFLNKDENKLWLISGTVLITFIVKGGATYCQAVLISRVGQRIVTDLQHRLYAHLTKMELGFFHNTPTGTLISRFTIDINIMRGAVSNLLVALGKDSLTLIALVGVMFFQDWQLAIIAFVVFPAAFIPIVRLGKRIRKVTVNTQEETGQLMTLLEQTFQGARVVKSYGMEEYEKNRVRIIAESIFRLVYKSDRVRAVTSPIMETLGGFSVAIVIAYGGYRVIHNAMDPGSFFSFITALIMAYDPLKRLANINNALQQGLAGAERLFQLLDREPTILEKPNAQPLSISGGGGIHLDDVHFSYVKDQAALSGVSFDVPAGKTVALVGPSGAGKSTILNLIPRFYDVDRGSITIDGTDVKNVTFESLRSCMALVSQEITLFDDTIRANIAYGRQDASEEEIIEAAKNAAAHDFIMEMPDGYDTYVGERGMKVSGGQRQRLAIARAMLKNAPILLLDEATSALDTESERHVQLALTKLMQGRTTLVIAHRLSTVMDADLIHVIDNGGLAESGSHAELIAKDGLYARLYQLQFREDATTEPAADTTQIVPDGS